MLNVTDLRKSYGSFEALSGVSFEIESGEMFGLLGPNGAGKSTLLGVLACLHDATSGEVRLAGEILRRDNLAQRQLLGIGTQELAIYGDLTARENLRFFGKLYGFSGKELTIRVDEVLELTALRDKADQRAGTFSGGMKRRLNLGVAIVHRPKVLFLDEPTTGVDPQSRNHIFEQVKALNAAGLTVIYTSHYMEEVQALCPRIAIMDHGKLIACDTLKNLLRKLDDTVTFRVNSGADHVKEKLTAAGIKISKSGGNSITVAGPAVAGLVVKVMGILRELDLELTGFQSEETNLEKVFLHLTERTLRD
ncbi:ABC transporter ATP-binding protein [Zavarzinella formosa]|uniref:ABC transporter ATP-binding protein n=1 Tax=Zavarzinella formosa TaxID=360055 RepID=UPI0002DA88F0|nr:ABC transporter ATP-binding protein [Zavarzinella formosa]